MKRKDFLAILTATPFALKGLLLTHGFEHVTKYTKNPFERKILNRAGLALKADGEVVGYADTIDMIRPAIDISTAQDLPNRRWLDGVVSKVQFHNLLTDVDLLQAQLEDKIIDWEIYRPHSGQYINFTGRLLDLELSVDVEDYKYYAGTIQILGTRDESRNSH